MATGIGRTNVVVPEEYSQTIIDGTIAESAALSLCGRLPMGTLIEHMPVINALPTAAFVNPRDSGKKALTTQEWLGVTLTAEEIAAVVTVPQALLDDASFDIFGRIQPRISEAFGAAIDAAVFFGTGAPASWPAGGIVGHAVGAGNSFTTGSDATNYVDFAAEISRVMELIEADGFDVDGFSAPISTKGKLRNLRDKNNQLLYYPPLQGLQGVGQQEGGGGPASLWGEPLFYSKNASFDLAQALLVAGDFDMAVIGLRQDMRAQVLTEATFTNADGTVAVSLAEQDMVALRCYMRLGFALANPVSRLNSDKDRTVADAVLNSSTTLTSATAAFVAGDVGKLVTGTGIPAGTTIASRTNATTVILSAAATATASGVTITVTNKRSPFAILHP